MGGSRSRPTVPASRSRRSVDLSLASVSSQQLRPVYLLTGTDKPKIGRALQRLRSRFAEGAIDHLSADAVSGEDAVAACNALGLFEGGRLVIVEGVERWKAADAKPIAAYLDDPAPATVLALVGDELKAGSALAKACAKAGDVRVWNVQKRKLPDWVAEQFARLGASADRDACEALVELVGEGLDELSSEVEKVATWAGGEPIGARDVELLAVAGRDVAPWALSDAWGARDVAGVLTACESELERKEPFVLAARLASHVGLIRAAGRLAHDGLASREVARRLDVHEFRARKALAQTENYSPDELDGALVRLAELDAALKGASRLSGELELVRALVEITRPAAPAAV
jgi:DNA polymerase-3 subunit delta